MVFNHNIVDAILDSIFPLPKNFGICLSSEEGEDYDGIVGYFDILNSIKDIDPFAYLDWGVSKLVIISPEAGDIVIKIPFHGRTESIDVMGYEEDVFCKFEAASGSDPSDYCLAEYEKYENLKAESLECFLAHTELYQYRDNYAVLVQEKVVPKAYDEGKRLSSLQSEKIAKEWLNSATKPYFPLAWMANCIDKYGVEKAEAFLKYCDTVDPYILEDVHSGNYGYRPDGSPVLLDFSGYSE